MSVYRLNIRLLVILPLIVFTSCDPVQNSYYPEGGLKSETRYDRDGNLHGESVWYFRNGKPEIIAQYSHGELHGAMSRWMPNGIKVAEDHFTHGKQSGLSMEWDYTGRKILEQNYEDGMLHGPSRKWHTNGQLREEGEYLNGMLHGQWFYWDIAGNLVGRGEFEHGSGYQYLYTPFGKEIGKYRFEDNEPVDPGYPQGIY